MTATPLRQAQRHTDSTRRVAEVAAPLSAQQSGTGLLLGLLGVVGAFAAVPIALSHPAVGVLLLLLGLALLAVLMLRRGQQAAPTEDDLWAGVATTEGRASSEFLSDLS